MYIPTYMYICTMLWPVSPALFFYYSHKENLYSKETEVLKLPLSGRYCLSFQDATNTVSIAYNTLFWSPFFVEYQPILQSSAQAPPPNKALPGTSSLHSGESLCFFLGPLEPLCVCLPTQVQVPWEQVFIPFNPEWYCAYNLGWVDAQWMHT